MAEMRLIDANELYMKFIDGKTDTEQEKSANQLARYLIRHSPNIDPETLPIVRELRDENIKAECRADALMSKILVLEEQLAQVTAEREKAVKDRAKLSDLYLTMCEQFCFGDRKRDIAPCEWNWFGRCKLREWCGPQKEADNE